ncbi:hypothetical protein CHISP_3099 [Chitinispirillum alkaliphilum]|nr:hypothetical protein CHISP_3099 [Chitinispirillum alkaliphilum]
MNRFSWFLIHSVLLFFICIPSVLANAASIDSLVRKGLEHFDTEQHDSSLYYFKTATAFGMSEDSLYYLWSKLYLSKGVVDTALALNLATSESVSQNLRESVLKQRHVIYSILGWKNEASKLLDSIPEFGEKRNNLFPRLTLNLGALYLKESVTPINYLPYWDIGPFVSNLPGGFGDAEVEWQIPLTGKKSILLGAAGLIRQNRFTQPFKANSIGDSLETEMTAFIRGVNFIQNINTGYTFKSKLNYRGTRTNAHNFDLHTLAIVNNWVHYYRFSSEFEHGEDTENVVRISFNSLNSRILNQKLSLNFLSRISVLHTEAIEFTYDPMVNLFYYDDGVYYEDSSFSTPQTVNFPFQLQTLRDDLLLTTYIPESRVELGMSKGVSYSAGRFNAGVNFGYNINVYTGIHQWYRLRYLDTARTNVPTIGGNPKSVIYSRDGSYYLATDLDRASSELTFESKPLSIQKRRIDHTLQSSLSFRYNLSACNSLHLIANLRRSFTNMPQNAPVELKPLTFQLRANWRMELNRLRS